MEPTLFFLLGATLGSFLIWLMYRLKIGHFQTLAREILKNGEQEAQEIKHSALFEAKELMLDQKREFYQQKDDLRKQEEKCEEQIRHFEKKMLELKTKETSLEKRSCDLSTQEETVLQCHQQLIRHLEEIASLSVEEARERLYQTIEQELQPKLTAFRRHKIEEAEESAEQEAARVVTTAINRMAAHAASEHTINTVAIPNEEMKGRIIGREGRNIRCLERETGVNFLIDDTPGAIVLSCFDPVRLHIAKVALKDLIADGRIHPTRIEEIVAKANQKVIKEMQIKAEDAAMQAGAVNLHPKLLSLLGQLAYRYSFGQNILSHSLEVSALMGLMAAELKLDIQLAKRIGLLHDIGKAVTHEMDGSHAKIGYHLTLQCGEAEKVANGIGCHHGEMEPISFEGSLCNAADSLSASRPGARLESIETYIKRLTILEKMARDYPGVEKVYALQSGREVRVSVYPDLISDEAAKELVQDLTRRIEEELKYPGKIKITLIREKRIVEYAY